MMKSVLKHLYDFLVSLRLKHHQEEKRLSYLMSFKGNNNGWLDEVIQLLDVKIAILYTQAVEEEAKQLQLRYPQIEILPLTPGITFFTKTLSMIGKSRWLLCDNYFPLLASISSKTQRIGMVWHANGAIKCFGACDPKNKERTRSENKRFLKVYQHYTDFFVGSKAMAEVFHTSYHMPMSKAHLTGFVRSDHLINQKKEQLKEAFYRLNPNYQGKQIVLYAPTYREHEQSYPFQAEWVTEVLQEAVVIERYHPHVQQVSTKVSGTLEMLLAAADICITDYSSIPFDYALLHHQGKMIFYQYDLEEYKERFGIEPLFEGNVPGPVVQTKTALQQALQQEDWSFESFNQQWNTYNDGQATKRMLEVIKEDLL